MKRSVVILRYSNLLNHSFCTQKSQFYSTETFRQSIFISRLWCFPSIFLPSRTLFTTSRIQDSAKAAVLKEFGKPLVLEEKKIPEKLRKGEVRLKVHYSGVNNTDSLLISGQYDPKIKLPIVPGFEVAGEVEGVGEDVTEFKKGDRVVGLNKEWFSTFAEKCIIRKEDLWLIPQSVKSETAVAIVDSYTTAHIALARRADLQPNDTVLVTAAASSLGIAVVDIAANVYKAKVIGLCGTNDKADFVREKGAFAALKYDRKDMLKTVADLTNGQGVKVIVDAVGGDVFNDCMDCVAHEGKMIVAGFASRKIPSIQTSQLLPKSFALIGVSLSHYRKADLKMYRDSVQEVLNMADEQLIEPHASAVFKLEQINEAIQFLDDRKSTGKILIKLLD